jgi:hypothetical protein
MDPSQVNVGIGLIVLVGPWTDTEFSKKQKQRLEMYIYNTTFVSNYKISLRKLRRLRKWISVLNLLIIDIVLKFYPSRNRMHFCFSKVFITYCRKRCKKKNHIKKIKGFIFRDEDSIKIQEKVIPPPLLVIKIKRKFVKHNYFLNFIQE